MAHCIEEDGTLTPPARALLRLIEKPLTLGEIADALCQPRERVLHGLEEMVRRGWVKESKGRFKTTESGRIKAG